MPAFMRFRKQPRTPYARLTPGGATAGLHNNRPNGYNPKARPAQTAPREPT